jgi:predicted RNA-binding protein YlxR (DUF448 family)
MKRTKHVPQRSCAICRQKRDKRRLTRLVRTAGAGVLVDPTGKQNGRGAYLCDQPECWDKATQTQVLDKVLATLVSEAEKAAIAAHRPVGTMVRSGKDGNGTNKNINRNS